VRLLLVIFVFLTAEVLLFWLVSYGYDSLARRGALPWSSSLKRRALMAVLLLPGLYAALAAFGFMAVNASPGISLYQLAGLPTPGPPPPVAPELETPEPEPFPPQDGEIRTPGPDELPTNDLLTPIPTSIPSEELPAMGDAPAGKIVYTCQIFKTGFRDQICIMNADGTGYRRLTREDQWDHNFPSLAPDGRSVVYVGKEPQGSFQVFEMDLDTEAYWSLTEGETDSAPAISPDGSLVVFNRLWEGANTIWVMDRDGGNPRMVFGLPEGHGWDPVWSPDGRRILLASDREGGVQLYTIGLDGSDLQRVTSLLFLRGRSDWSLDGSAIATYVGEPWQREIIIMEPEGSNPQVITHGGNNLAPSFSPDGQWITFTSYRDNFRDELGCEIYIMRRDGSDIIRLTDNDICDWQPRWGP
jgi:TolB protein